MPADNRPHDRTDTGLSRRGWLRLSAAGLVGAAAAGGVDAQEPGAGGAAPPRPVRAEDRPAAWLDCTFGPLPGGGTGRLLIMTLGDRVERVAVVPLGLAVVDGSGLQYRGGRVTGEIVVGHEPLRENHTLPPEPSRMPLRLHLTVEGDRVRGTFAGSWPRSDSRRGERVDVRGEVTGTRRDEQALRAENGLPEGAAWPSYVGPNQNFSSGQVRGELIDDLNLARLVWVSQYIGPPESGSQRYGACVGVPPAAGGASPLVRGGRVYQFRYQPTGDVYQRHLDTQMEGPRGDEWRRQMAAVGWTMADMRRRWAIDADEQLVCLDAATGKSLWSITWPASGLHLYDHKCSLTNHTGVAADGRVYVFGALGTVRCVDADSGAVRWQADVPGYSAAMQQLKARALRERHLHAPSRSFCHGLNISGGTVIAPDGIGGCGLVGLDAGTGRVLWRVPGVLGKTATPLAWRHDGTDYVVAANGDGQIACIEAGTGRVAWRYGEAGENHGSVILSGDYLVGLKLRGEAREQARGVEDPGGIHTAPGDNYGRVACWRLTPRGPEEVWVAPAEWGAPWNCPVGAATDGLVCFRGKYSYYLVRVATGERVAATHLPTAVRWDEGHLLAMPGLFVLHPDSQHGQTKMFPLPARPGATAGPLWTPPHPPATTYEAAMSHAWADGRLFIRGVDAIYCYDLRRPRG